MTPDVLPKLITELRADAALAALVGDRIAGVEPKGAWVKGPGQYVAHVVLVQLDASRITRTPVQRFVIEARCYGRDFAEAAAVRWAVSEALHLAGGRTFANGLGIYQTLDESGGAQEKDPQTDQPYQLLTITGHATTMAAA